MGRALISFQITVVILCGVALGAAGYHMVVKSGEALALAQQCNAGQALLTKELNERVLPAIHEKLAAAAAAAQAQSKIAK